jgi:hypothetical protein
MNLSLLYQLTEGSALTKLSKMKATTFVNTLESYITNQQIVEVMEGLNDPFYGKFVKEDLEVSVSLWDVRALISGYGHWKVTVELELNFGKNKKKLVLTHTTTNAEAIDNYNDCEDDELKSEGYLSLFSACVNAKEYEVYEALDVED